MVVLRRGCAGGAAWELAIPGVIVCSASCSPIRFRNSCTAFSPCLLCSEGASEAFDMVFSGGKADDITVVCAAMH